MEDWLVVESSDENELLLSLPLLSLLSADDESSSSNEDSPLDPACFRFDTSDSESDCSGGAGAGFFGPPLDVDPFDLRGLTYLIFRSGVANGDCGGMSRCNASLLLLLEESSSLLATISLRLSRNMGLLLPLPEEGGDGDISDI